MGIVKEALGTTDIPEIATTSPTAPGVTHRWTNMTAFTEEIANVWVTERGQSLYHIICLEVEDIDSALNELRGKGFKLVHDTRSWGMGGAASRSVPSSNRWWTGNSSARCGDCTNSRLAGLYRVSAFIDPSCTGNILFELSEPPRQAYAARPPAKLIVGLAGCPTARPLGLHHSPRAIGEAEFRQ
jgi:hypothetical protein